MTIRPLTIPLAALAVTVCAIVVIVVSLTEDPQVMPPERPSDAVIVLRSPEAECPPTWRCVWEYDVDGPNGRRWIVSTDHQDSNTTNLIEYNVFHVGGSCNLPKDPKIAEYILEHCFCAEGSKGVRTVCEETP